MTLPLWLIRRECYTDSVRLTKRPPQVKAWVQTGFSLGGRQQTRWETANDWEISGLRMLKGRVNPGNLLKAEYEHWIGYPYKAATGSTCRFCRHSASGQDGRRNHFSVSQVECARMTKQIARLLQKDSLCVVCNKRAKKCVWGFPLCSLECVANWQFELTEHKAFTQARVFLMAQLRRGK